MSSWLPSADDVRKAEQQRMRVASSSGRSAIAATNSKSVGLSVGRGEVGFKRI